MCALYLLLFIYFFVHSFLSSSPSSSSSSSFAMLSTSANTLYSMRFFMQIGKPRAKQIKMNDGRNTILVQKSLKYGVLLLTPRAHSYTRENISESSSSGGNNNIQTHWLLVCLLTHSPTVNLNINWWCCWVSLSLSVGWLVRLFGFIRFVRNCLSTTTIASHRETHRERESEQVYLHLLTKRAVQMLFCRLVRAPETIHARTHT